MILIIGGAAQGKTKFAFQLLRRTQIEPAMIADGRVDSYEMILERPVIIHFHEYIRRIQANEQGKILDFDQLLAGNQNAIILMNEVGYGVVPVEPEERSYRELVGAAGQELASRASCVYRVVCGIAQQIK